MDDFPKPHLHGRLRVVALLNPAPRQGLVEGAHERRSLFPPPPPLGDDRPQRQAEPAAYLLRELGLAAGVAVGRVDRMRVGRDGRDQDGESQQAVGLELVEHVVKEADSSRQAAWSSHY